MTPEASGKIWEISQGLLGSKVSQMLRWHFRTDGKGKGVSVVSILVSLFDLQVDNIPVLPDNSHAMELSHELADHGGRIFELRLNEDLGI